MGAGQKKGGLKRKGGEQASTAEGPPGECGGRGELPKLCGCGREPLFHRCHAVPVPQGLV